MTTTATSLGLCVFCCVAVNPPVVDKWDGMVTLFSGKVAHTRCWLREVKFQMGREEEEEEVDW